MYVDIHGIGRLMLLSCCTLYFIKVYKVQILD